MVARSRSREARAVPRAPAPAHAARRAPRRRGRRRTWLRASPSRRRCRELRAARGGGAGGSARRPPEAARAALSRHPAWLDGKPGTGRYRELRMRHRSIRTSQCARALWLLGLRPPVEEDELARAWKQRVARTHPDLHASSEQRSEAATVLTRALNDARDVVQAWIESGREWPEPAMGGRREAARPRPPAPEPATSAVCRRTALRAGDR